MWWCIENHHCEDKTILWLSYACRKTGPGPWFNIKMPSYQYRKSHFGDKMVVRSSYLHNGISYTGKMTSLCWIRALGLFSDRHKTVIRSSYLHNGDFLYSQSQAGYLSNLACDWLSIVWAYSKEETENRPWWWANMWCGWRCEMRWGGILVRLAGYHWWHWHACLLATGKATSHKGPQQHHIKVSPAGTTPPPHIASPALWLLISVSKYTAAGHGWGDLGE